MANNEFGDFQTPLPLAQRCLEVLGFPTDTPAQVLEPTCGVGSFLHAAQTLNPQSDRYGLEINEDYVKQAQQFANVRQTNIFTFDLRGLEWNDTPVFVIGNPPWVTASELQRMGSENLPKKENFKGVRGIDAMLGGSNFDVCEYIILKCLNELSSDKFTLGMLCKTQVARNVLVQAHKVGIPLSSSAIYPIDAIKHFGAAVDACWFTAVVDPQTPASYVADIYTSIDDTAEAVRRFGIVDGVLVSDVDAYVDTKAGDGTCPFEWRSGLKHDASKVFELKATPAPITKDGEPVDVEDKHLFPLLKGTDIFRGRHTVLSKWVIVPQMHFGEETKHLEHTAPKLWEYLTKHAEALDGRKSSIYRNRPRFSVFGHGEYTFAPFKVACSGMHKDAKFQLIAPIEGKPVVLDDISYFLPFEDGTEAAMATAILRSHECQKLISSLVFWDSKRPLNKKLLARIDLFNLPCDRDEIHLVAQEIAAEAGIAFDPAKAESFYPDEAGADEGMLF
ncbi:class I SAM-dependent methyltransferase [Corynebacterium hindlerae]|uniref:Class I SAM-dependent methyltransferase n=1 Tax=Corynebacterium hindlerae TaxID=699041 RepID=A0A7G5FGU7_9CORY|nr:class I SAM-dependent methyltransferase [Corynebacterium hindlerae]QMV85838.1 class I SAM-dependent methyltransferase [Corynebacterium hindlerae]